MDEILVKEEFSEFSSIQCRACLSIGRKLRAVGDLEYIYRKLLENDFAMAMNVADHMLCWECYTILERFAQFRSKVKRANQILWLGQATTHGTLSSLITVVDNHNSSSVVYININNEIGEQTENILKIQVKEESLQENRDMKEIKVTHENNEKENKGDKKGRKESKPKTNNRWAKTRAILNKIPKFNILNLEHNLKSDKLYREVCLNAEELEDLNKSEMSKFKCMKCMECCISEMELLKHCKDIHEQLKLYICGICNKTIESKNYLRAHIKEHYIKYECVVCRHTSRDRSDVEQHVCTHTRVYQCATCELKFGSRRDFFKHYKQWHERFVCDHCGVRFKMKYCIEEHIRKQHSPLQCKQCPCVFANYKSLWRHARGHHAAPPSPPARPAYCVECDTSYRTVAQYKSHLANSASHRTGEARRIPCPGCDKVFSKNIYMKDHYNLVHLNQYKYRCDECNKNFTRNADLRKHRQRAHSGAAPPPRHKLCALCGRGFTTNKILENHMRTHTGERPFSCAACGARFTQSAALAAHARALHPAPH